MNLYKIHNIFWYILVITLVLTLISGFFISHILAQILYVTAFFIAMILQNLKIRIKKLE